MVSCRRKGDAVVYRSIVAKEIGSAEATLPNFVSIAPAPFFSPGAYSSGFLGPEFAPLMIGNAGYGFGKSTWSALNSVARVTSAGWMRRAKP